MAVLFGKKEKVKRVRGGREERRQCPECDATTTFREVTVHKEWTAYHVVKLWDSEKIAFQCDACDEVMDLDDTEEPELSAGEKAQQAKLREKHDRIAAKKAELERLQRHKEAQDQDQAIDDELAAMKKKLGLD
jgi:hypothetical protein